MVSRRVLDIYTKCIHPDLDGINDRFCISYGGIRENTFVFNLYNKNSELIFSTMTLVLLSVAVPVLADGMGKI